MFQADSSWLHLTVGLPKLGSLFQSELTSFWVSGCLVQAFKSNRNCHSLVPIPSKALIASLELESSPRIDGDTNNT